jgi:WD40 repeat protein
MKVFLASLFTLFQLLLNAQLPELGLPIGHNKPIKCFKFIENEEYIVSGGEDGQVILWETRSGKRIRTIYTGPKSITDLLYIENRSEIVICAYNRLPVIYNLMGDSITSFKGEQGEVNSITFLNDSTLLSDWKGIDLKIWNVNNFNNTFTLRGPGTRLTSFKSSNDGKKIAASFIDSIIYIWGVDKEYKLSQLMGHKNSVNSITFHNSESKFLSASSDSTVILWDLNEGKELLQFQHHPSEVMNAYFEPYTGDILTCSQNDSIIRRWDQITGALKPHNEDDKFAPIEILFSESENSRLLIGYRALHLLYREQEILWSSANPSGTSAHFFDDGNKIAISNYESIQIYDTRNGKLLNTLKTDISTLNGFDYDQKNKELLIFGGTLHFLDLLTGKSNHKLKKGNIQNEIIDASYRSDGNQIAILDMDGFITLFENQKPDSPITFNAHYYTGTGNHSSGHSVNFNKTGTNIITTGRDKYIRIWNTMNGTLVHERLSPYWPSQTAILDSLMTQAVSIANDNSLVSWNLKSKKDDAFLPGISENKNGLQYNPDETLYAAGMIKSINIYNTRNEHVTNLSGHKDWVEAIDFHPNGKNLISSDRSGELIIWDLFDQSKERRIKASNGAIHSVQFIENGNWFITSTSNEIKFWNSTTYENELTLLIFDSINFIIKNKEGYFMATQNAAPKVYYTIDNKTISFEQLDLKYNRPDLILKTLNKITGNQNDILREVLHLTYQKRLRKHGMDMNLFTNVLSFPEGEIKNRPQLEYEQSNQFLDIQISGKDSSSFLDRFNVWINDVPLYSENGINLKNSMTHYLDTTVQIELSYGLNRVEVSVTNVNGIESLRSPLFLNFSSISQKSPKTYFIGIGINEFEQTGHDLAFAVKDIHDFIEELKNHSKDLLIIDTLFNQSVTLYNVQAIKTQLEKLSVNDKVILSYSGHGLLDDQLNYYLSSFEVDFSNPKVGGIPYETIEFLLDGIPSRRKLVLIDACNSGEIDKDTLHTSKFGESEKQSIIETSTKGDLFNTLNHLKDPFELINEMFMNIERGSGAFIISASGGYQSAHEGGNIKNGYFTYAILEFLKNHHSVSVTELYKYIVPRVEQLSEGKQRPTTRMQNMNVDWQIY